MAHPAVSIALAAPSGRDELVGALRSLGAEAPSIRWMKSMRDHGRRVHRHAREFW